jgi:tetratricopeptide (TPR) repeat protein
MVGCKIIHPNGMINSAEFLLSPMMAMGRGEADLGQRDYTKEADALIGPCWLMKRDCVRRAGYFDLRFYPCQYEDIDFCIRARLAGCRIMYTGRVKVVHNNLYRDGSKFDYNGAKFLRKWKGLEYPFPDSEPSIRYNAAGYRLFVETKFRRALAEFKRAKNIDRRYSLPHYMSMSEIALGNYPEAIRILRGMLRTAPADHFTRYMLGYVFTLLKKYNMAAVEYKMALRSRPSSRDIYYKLGAVYAAAGKHRLSKLAYARALTCSPAGELAGSPCYISSARAFDAFNDFIYKGKSSRPRGVKMAHH